MIASLILWLVCTAVTDRGEASPVESQQTDGARDETLTGMIRDASGAPLPGASIVIRSRTRDETRATSGADGRFAAPVSTSGDLEVVVRADGFAEKRQHLRAGTARSSLEIVLAPAGLSEMVTVTA